MNVFERRGVRTVINAAGTVTRLSGGIMRSEVAAAMAESSSLCVEMTELEAHASEIIANVTGAEAGYITAGASAGLLLATAACLTGLDPSRMAKLPDTTGMKNEVIIAQGQRNGYDHAVRAAGGKLVEVGLADRLSGAGVRDVEGWEFAEAINEKTAAVFYVAGRNARPPLSEVVEVARQAGMPVIVDAAAELPPQSNLRRFIAEGADLVAFSGGKAIGGPQASGILCGRRDLVMSAALQHLDLDVLWDFWSPPASLIDKSRIKGLPRHGIGRSCKVGKEEIIGLLTALELFVAEGDAERHGRWLLAARKLVERLASLERVEVALTGASDVQQVPKVELRFARGAERAAARLIHALLDSSPPVHVDQTFIDRGVVTLDPVCLRPGEAEVIARVVLNHLR